MKALLALLAASAVVFLAGCASDTTDISRVKKGMTKGQVIAILGTPDSVVEAPGGVEFLRYKYLLVADPSGDPGFAAYEVILVKGKAASYESYGTSNFVGDITNTTTVPDADANGD